MKGHQQPTGRAQSPLSSAFPIIILLDNCLSSTLKVLVDGTVPKTVHLESCQGLRSGTLVLANSLHGQEDWLQVNMRYSDQ